MDKNYTGDHSNIVLQSLYIDDLMTHEAIFDPAIYKYEGVWWREIKPFISMPAWQLSSFRPGEIKPHPLRSFIASFHVVPNGSTHNAKYPFLIIDHLDEYCLENLKKETRKKIRKGLRTLEVCPMKNLEQLISEGYQVYLSWKNRVSDIKGPIFSDFSLFKRWIKSEYYFGKKTILGAYFRGKLIAFTIGYALGEVAYCERIYSDDAYHALHPVEALYYQFINASQRTPGVKLVSCGPYSYTRPTLNDFKIRQGFKIINYPAYAKINPCISLFLRIFGGKRRFSFLNEFPSWPISKFLVSCLRNATHYEYL